MPVELKDFRLKLRRKIDLQLSDDATLTFWWSPEKYNDSFMQGTAERAAAEKEAEEGDEAQQQAYCLELAEGMIVPLVTAWDLVEDGKPYPITPENVADLGIFVVSKMSNAINDDATDFRDVGKG